MAIRFNTPDEVRQAYERFVYDPALWVEFVLGVSPATGAKRIDPQVRQILDAVGALFKCKDYQRNGLEHLLTPKERILANKKGVSTRSGQGTGKDTANSWVMAWLGDCWPNTKVIVSAPKLEQAKTVLWAEFRKWIDRKDAMSGSYIVPEFVRRKYEVSAESIKYSAGSGFCQIMTCPRESDPDSPSMGAFGQHADEMVIIFTEADGVPESVIFPLVNSMTGGINFAMMAFNPRRTSGYAYKSHMDPVERKRWIALHHSAENSTLVNAQSLEDKAAYGKDSDYYRVYALGEFPRGEDNAIIKWEWIVNAIDRDIEVPEDYPTCTGVDPAGEGRDRTTFVSRRMGELVELLYINQTKRGDTKEELIERLSRKHADRKYIDSNGLGYYLYVELAREIPNLRRVESQGRARNDDKFFNKRAEMWFNCAEAFQQGLVSIPNNERLVQGLSVAKWKPEQKKLQVIAKKDIKKKLGHSPDEAEAFVMTFADGFQYYREDEAEVSDYRRTKKGYNKKKLSFMGV